jgi:uncharacterized membrane protein
MAFHGNLLLSLPHLIAGLTALAAAAFALCALKGGTFHRRSGTVFAYAMLLVAVSGIAMAAVKCQRMNLIGGLLTLYMVSTALRTARRRVQEFHWVDVGLMLLGLATGVLGITVGFEALNSATGRIDGLPPAPAFMFGAVALLGVAGDIRMLARGARGAPRIARHLWRMCFALFSAAGSFFPAQVPKALPSFRGSVLLWIPPLLVLLIMLYWLVRVRFTQRRWPGGASDAADPRSLPAFAVSSRTVEPPS